MRGKIGNIRKRKMLKTILAGAACLSLAAAFILTPEALAQGARTPLDWEKKDDGCSITIDPGDLEGMEQAGITVDLYQVAYAVKTDGYDTYSYELSEEFKALGNTQADTAAIEDLEDAPEGDTETLEALEDAQAADTETPEALEDAPEALEEGLAEDNLPNLTDEGWRDLSQKAARIALGYQDGETTAENGPAAVTAKDSISIAPGEKSVTFSGIGFGLYLVVARDADYDSPASYSMIKEAGDADGTSSLVTMAYTDTEVYTFLPVLISLPSAEMELPADVGDENQTDTGEWQYHITAVLKPEESPLYGQLNIVKTLTSYQEGDPVVFVYQIDVYDKEGDGRILIDSGSVSISFQAPGVKTQPVEGIKLPVGSYVVVTEVYSGPSYTAANPVWSGTISTGKTEIGSPGEAESATFENEYDGRVNGGGYIINRFTYETDENGGSWDLEQIYNFTDAAGE